MIPPEIDQHFEPMLEELAKLDGPSQAIATVGIVATLTMGQDEQTIDQLCATIKSIHRAFEHSEKRRGKG